MTKMKNLKLKSCFILLAMVWMAQGQLSCSKSKDKNYYPHGVMSTECLFSPSSCDRSPYEISSDFGINTYEHDRDEYFYNDNSSYGNYDYFCGCQMGTHVPIYHEAWGLACASRFRLEQSIRRRSSHSVLIYRYDRYSESLFLNRNDSFQLPKNCKESR